MKYGNRKTIVDGIKFDSKAEAERYKELRMMEQSGVITDLKCQPKFQLIPTFVKDGKTFRGITYIADFSYIQDGRTVVEDVKGYKTEVYKLKRKMFEYYYSDLKLEEIMK